MATAQEAVKRAITEHVVPALRADGFKGTWPTWRRANVAEDAAVVNVQLSQWNAGRSRSMMGRLPSDIVSDII